MPTPARGERGAVEPEGRIRRSLRYSVYDALAHAAMLGLGESYFVAFAVSIGASAVEIGYLTTGPLLIGSLLQLLSPAVVARVGSRRRVVVSLAFLQALMYLPLVGLAWTAGRGPASPVLILIGVATVYHSALLFINPVWQSWMGDLLAASIKGRYLGFRNLAAGAVHLLIFLGSGVYLNLSASEGRGRTTAFAVMFMLAFVARGISVLYLRRQHEPRMAADPVPAERVTLRRLLFRRGEFNSAALIFYLAAMNFSVYIAVPFFSPLMFRGLRFTYLEYTLVSASAILAKFAMMPFWGRMCDRHGARRILLFSGISVAMIPFYWCFLDVPWLLGVAELFSGASWAAFELASFYFLLDTISPERRSRLLSLSQALTGVSVFAGMNVGAFLASVGTFQGSSLLLPIFASGVARLVVGALFWRRIREVRSVVPIRYDQLLFRMLTWYPTTGLTYSIGWLRRTLQRPGKAPGPRDSTSAD
ncbi:MAG: MFS transporter [Candidatus Zixiibacteriota bacterium]